jgi:hypothetical protein
VTQIQPPDRATVCLAMIVKDEEANLPACLDSARGLFDEMVVVDTGSTDRTEKIARSYGARVFPFTWCDDFSAARNFGLDRVRSDFVFRLDADDRIPPDQHPPFRALLAGLRRDHPEAIAFQVEAEGPAGTPKIVSDEIRLWPNQPQLRFIGRVHEQIGSALMRLGIPNRPGAVRLEHLGYADGAVFVRKLQRNERLILLDLAQRPDDPACLFELGRCRSALGDPRGAVEALTRSLDLFPADWDLYARMAYRLVAHLHQQLGDPQAALRAAQAGVARFPDDATLIAWVADLHAAAGHLEEAAEGYRKILALGSPGRMEAGIHPQFRDHVAAALAGIEARLNLPPNRPRRRAGVDY